MSRLLPPSPPTRGSGCLQLHPAATTAERSRSSTSIRTNSASWRTYTAGRREVQEGPPEVTGPPATIAFLYLISTFFGVPREKRPRKPDFCSGWKTARREGAVYDRSSGVDSAPRAAGRAYNGPQSGGRVYDGGAHRRGARHRAPVVPAPRAAPSRRAGYRPAPARGSALGVKPGPAPGRVDLTGGRSGGWMLAVPGGRPARPVGRQQGRPPPPPATARARTRSPPGITPRPPLPAFPSGRPGRPPAPPGASAGPFLFPPVPGLAVPASRLPPSARRGADLTGRAERSVRRRGPTDGPPREPRPLPAGPPPPPTQHPEPRATRC